jgi:hypothetical protein
MTEKTMYFQHMKWLVFALFACLFAATARAEIILARGNIDNGKHIITMELNDNDGEVDGRYFYDKHKQDIPLHGTRQGDTWRLTRNFMGDDEQDKAVETFVLARTDDMPEGTWQGTYTSAKGKMLPVMLAYGPSVPQAVVDPRPDLSLSDDPEFWSGYERLRMMDLKFIAGEKQTIDGKYQVQWLREPLSGFSMFHVVGGYPEAVMTSINRIVDRNFYHNLSNYFSCSNESGPGMDSLTASLELANDRFVSYSVSSSWDCDGAAHPDFSTQGTTINAKTGERLALDDVYWVGDGEKPARDSDGWYKYRSDVFAPAIVELFQQLYPQQMKKTDDEDDCDYTEPDSWNFPDWYLTDKGLYIGASFARVMRVCDNPDWSIIPYRILKKNNPALFGN